MSAADKNILRSLSDPKLLGAALGDPAPWRNWVAIWKAAFGLGSTMAADELAFFAKVAGGRSVPAKRTKRLTILSGRRSGKSRQTAAVGCALALYADRSRLAPGETGFVMIVAPTKDQATTIKDYAEGFLRASPILEQQIESVSAEEIRLKGNVALIVSANSFRNVRGKSLVACLVDEACFLRDSESATPDIELSRAVLPALLTTDGMWIAISSAYRKSGLMHAKWRDFYGKDDPAELVIQAATTDLNLTIDEAEIQAALADDYEAAKSEYLSEWRSDLSALLDDATIDAAVIHGRPLELPFDPEIKHRRAFVDMSGGRNDASTLTIGHKDAAGRFVAEVIRGRQAPHDPASVVAEFVALFAERNIHEIVGDNYAGAWVAGAFAKAGMTYRRSALNKSQLYLESVPIFMQGRIEIPDHKQCVRELRLLERRVAKSGRDSVDHPRNGTDDFANSLVGCVYHVMRENPYNNVALAGVELFPEVEWWDVDQSNFGW